MCIQQFVQRGCQSAVCSTRVNTGKAGAPSRCYRFGMKLLLVEDDAAMRTTLARSFERRGMQVLSCDDGRRALDRWRASVPDAVLLDLTLPGCDGLEILAAARREGLRTPVILVTARGTVGDRVLGLNTGADDYLPKPFDLDELEARIRALVRRGAGVAGGNDAPMSEPLRAEFMGLAVDPSSGAVEHRGRPMELAPREAALLGALLQRPGHAVAKDRLLQRVFPDDPSVQPEAIEVVAYRLRKKLVGIDVELATLRGLGYLLRALPAAKHTA
jgi:two-component system, OmpR family, response regulator TctD